MKKIIGGILIIICLSQPSHLIKDTKISSGLLHIQQYYVKVVSDTLKKEDTTDTETEKEEGQLQSLLASLHTNSRRIGRLLENKRDITDTVHKMIDQKAKTRQRMTESQIAAFSEFTKKLEVETPKLHMALQQINDLKDMKEAQQEIMKDHVDYYVVQNQIGQIVDYQEKAIKHLKQIISLGDSTAELLG